MRTSRNATVWGLFVVVTVIVISTLWLGPRRSAGEDRNLIATGLPAPTPGDAVESFAGSSPIDRILQKLTPKREMEVIPGEKTIAPAVPAPITRRESKIVEYDLAARETSAQIAPDVSYQSLWTFDGVVPGPVMRIRVGDVVRFTLRNEQSNLIGHNIDFHFISGACGGCGDTIVKPGESKTIEVRALYPGLFMYHCAYSQDSNIVAVHLANGMYGYLIVDPESPLPTVAHEFMLVQSEFYGERAAPRSKLFTCSQRGLVDETPTHVFFNGKHAALTSPLSVNAGDRVRLYVGKGGVNGFSAFHVIGAVFDKVYQDGGLIDPPVSHGIQTVTVPTGGATIVEFVAPVPGTLVAVDHNLSRVSFKGLGQIIQVNGSPNSEIYSSSSSGASGGGGGEAQHKH
jgi:nitrite reductase (NO-forming)